LVDLSLTSYPNLVNLTIASDSLNTLTIDSNKIANLPGSFPNLISLTITNTLLQNFDDYNLNSLTDLKISSVNPASGVLTFVNNQIPAVQNL
jgi:hypothetical protein